MIESKTAKILYALACITALLITIPLVAGALFMFTLWLESLLGDF